MESSLLVLFSKDVKVTNMSLGTSQNSMQIMVTKNIGGMGVLTSQMIVVVSSHSVVQVSVKQGVVVVIQKSQLRVLSRGVGEVTMVTQGEGVVAMVILEGVVAVEILEKGVVVIQGV